MKKYLFCEAFYFYLSRIIKKQFFWHVYLELFGMPTSIHAMKQLIQTEMVYQIAIDFCPNLLEDYDPQYGNNIDGCPADFVPWYDADYDGIQDHLDDCPTVKETYNKFQDTDGCPDSSPDDW